MSVKRVVDTGFWTDEKVMNDFSPEDRYFFLYLLTNPHTTQLGIYHLNKKYMSLETGYTSDTIETILDRFENKYQMIRRSKTTSEIAIKNYLKYSIVKGGKPVEDLLIKEAEQVKSKKLLDYIFGNLTGKENINASVLKFLASYQNDNDNVNDNDNDNDDSYHESYHDSSKPQKAKYGTFKNVLLTDEEYLKLKEDFNNVDDKIEDLSGYMASKGNKYKSHYATLRNWCRKDNCTKTKTQSTSSKKGLNELTNIMKGKTN